jgi:uncharacterized SAM-binding protein YcdF (DUF218 family)
MKYLMLSPLFAGVLLALLLWLGRGRGPRWLRWIGVVALAGCYLLATSLGADNLVHAIEVRATIPCTAPVPQTVVVLAGGVDEDARDGQYIALNQSSLRRVIAGVALWRRQPPGTLLVLSGGSTTGNTAEGPLMAAFAEQLGVPATSIRVESTSETTWQNARNLAALQPPVPRRVWLVTSALHMPRALYAMRQAGFDPCTLPVDYRYYPPSLPIALLPSSAAIGKSDFALHELVGLAWYHFKAREAN